MRHTEQFPLLSFWIDHEHAVELATISDLLDMLPDVGKMVDADLRRKVTHPTRGAPGLTGDQVMRIAITQCLTGDDFRALAFRLGDSICYRRFCRLSPLQPTPVYQTLHANMAKIRPATWQAIHQILIQDALARQADTADRVRIDTTPVPTKIHAPSDSTLLYDGVRVLTRLCKQARTHTGFRDFHVHTRVAKRRMIAIQYTKPREKAQRTALYQDLLAATQQTLGESEAALLHCLSIQADHTSSRLDSLVRALTTMTALVLKVIDQTERRVLRHESVPATEKVVSLFEPHTDILVKDHRDTIYGHKICLTEGPSRLILDCNILHGNPPDSTLAIAPLRRLMEQYNVLPTQVAYDGGFASADNLHDIRGLGIPDVCFTKSRGLPQDAMVEDPHVYRALRRFRAGIESAISRLKRAFGLARCGWKGEAGFQRYVYARVVTANLMILAQQLC